MTAFFDLLQGPWAALLSVIAVLALVISRVRAIRGGLVDLRDWIHARLEPPREQHWPSELSARFASSRDTLQDVLDLRRRVFDQVLQKELIAEDRTYWDAFERNRYSFSILSEAGMPFGYWGVIPVSKKHYDQFVAGDMTHAQMLSDATLSWEAADPDAMYLYFVGTVSLNRDCLTTSEPRLRRMGYKVLIDATVALLALSTVAQIKGVAVYASTKYGWRVVKNKLLKNGFETTGEFAEEDRLTEIIVLREASVGQFFDALSRDHVDDLLSRDARGRTSSAKAKIEALMSGTDRNPRVPRRSLRESALVRRLIKRRDS